MERYAVNAATLFSILARGIVTLNLLCYNDLVRTLCAAALDVNSSCVLMCSE